MTDEDVVDPPSPDYGPRGYLPPRAAKRARKIILREPMGLQWAAAAVIAGLLVLLAGGVLLFTRSGPPDAPFTAVTELARIDPRGAGTVPLEAGRRVLVVRGAGSVRVFEAPPDAVTWCAQRSRLISASGAVWQPDGRLVGGTGGSLIRLPAQVHAGMLYVDRSSPGSRPQPVPRDEASTCPT